MCSARRSRPPPAPSWAAAALLAFLLAGQRALRPSSAAVWQRIDGQPLADAVARWGASNSDATFVLPAGSIVDLRDAQFGRNSTSRTSRPPFSNGTFTIKGQRSFESIHSPNATSASVLDAGMRASLVPGSGLAQVLLQDVSLVNLCLGAHTLKGVPFYSAGLLQLFGMTPVVQPVASTRAVRYVVDSDIAFYAYMTTLASSPWPAGEARARLRAAPTAPTLVAQPHQWWLCTPAVVERYAWQLAIHMPMLQTLSFEFSEAHETRVLQRPKPPVLMEHGTLMHRVRLNSRHAASHHPGEQEPPTCSSQHAAVRCRPARRA